MNTSFDALAVAHELKEAGLAEKQAEAIAKACRAAAGADLDQMVTKADLNAAVAKMGTELSQAVNRMLLAQVAVAGVLFAALKLWN